MHKYSKIWLQRIMIVLLSATFIHSAFQKVSGQFCEYYLSNGYTMNMLYAMALLECLTVVGLYFQSFKIKSCIIQILFMFGSFYAHLELGEILASLLNITVLGCAAIVIWVDIDNKYQQEYH